MIDGIRKVEYTITEPNSDPFAGPIGQGIKANRYVMIRALFIIVGVAMILISIWLTLRKKERSVRTMFIVRILIILLAAKMRKFP
ncbi:MAG: hypothetical protein LBT05_16800 [Planctomycetaceae bacterium]|nr:hypothetical protein [Planctomycetaceae bacterium]